MAGRAFVSWRRLAFLAALCASYKASNAFCFDPALNCAVVFLAAFAALETAACLAERRGSWPKADSFTGRRYIPRKGNGAFPA